MTHARPAAIVILAAGEGTRMRSRTPKVLHHIAGRSLLGHVVHAAAHTQPGHLVVVVGHGREQVQAHLEAIAPSVVTIVQEEQLGTGHAVRIALTGIAERGLEMPPGPIVVLTGDTPLLTGDTVQALLDDHVASSAAATVLTTMMADPTGYGRILRDPSGEVIGIVEHRDASEDQLMIDEINSGMYAFDPMQLAGALARIQRDNVQGEEYLTDVIGLIHGDGARVAASRVMDPDEVMGVNDRVQLSEAAWVMRDRINREWMRSGVSMLDPESTWIDVDVELAPDVLIRPNVTLAGPTAVSAGAILGPGTTLTSCEVGEGAEVIHTWAELAVIGAGAHVGPFTYLRPGTVLGEDSKAGAYVEIKNSTVGRGAKVPHLSYVGDAEIGEESNIGAATVFVNYDGVAKHRTVVGSHVRIGSDTMLVAPVTIGDGAYTAAGSVITQDVPPGAMAIGRAQQRTIADWVQRRRAGTPAAEAAARALNQQGDAADSAPSD